MSLVKRFSIDKARKIGYSPQFSLKKGVQNVVAWQRKEVLKH
jgi:nucleoside-diphosphate-sugar epimerase